MTRNPDAELIADSRSAVLPTPGSPLTTNTRLCPPRTSSSSRSSASRSTRRPCNNSAGSSRTMHRRPYRATIEAETGSLAKCERTVRPRSGMSEDGRIRGKRACRSSFSWRLRLLPASASKRCGCDCGAAGVRGSQPSTRLDRRLAVASWPLARVRRPAHRWPRAAAPGLKRSCRRRGRFACGEVGVHGGPVLGSMARVWASTLAPTSPMPSQPSWERCWWAMRSARTAATAGSSRLSAVASLAVVVRSP